MVISRSDERAKLSSFYWQMWKVKMIRRRSESLASPPFLPPITRRRDLVAACESRRRRADTLLFAHLSVISRHSGRGRNSTWQRCLSCSFVRSGCLDSFSTGPPRCCQPQLSGDLWCNCMAVITKEKKKLKSEDVVWIIFLSFFLPHNKTM